jgi:hypothetical protein
MKRWLLLLWLLVPLPVVVWHYGPGQRWLARDKAQDLLREAHRAEENRDHATAENLYRTAIGALGAHDPAIKMKMELAAVKNRYQQGGALDATVAADALFNDARFNSMPPRLQREARELAGRMHYYSAWVMRLEGARRELWLEEAELARQNFRMLAETGMAAGDKSYTNTQQNNLEAAVALQRMSMTELLAKPLPEEGRQQTGQGLSEQKDKQRKGRGQGDQPGVGENKDGPPASGAGTTRFPAGGGS